MQAIFYRARIEQSGGSFAVRKTRTNIPAGTVLERRPSFAAHGPGPSVRPRNTLRGRCQKTKEDPAIASNCIIIKCNNLRFLRVFSLFLFIRGFITIIVVIRIIAGVPPSVIRGKRRGYIFLFSYFSFTAALLSARAVVKRYL